jgi:hypothetical protein
MTTSSGPHSVAEEGRRNCGTLNRLRAHSKPSPSKPNYPPVSSIPRTSAARLIEDVSPDAESTSTDTVLYLAYGSNLSAETFLGRRGIRPVSQVNVSAPTLRLTFDLPGQPYIEPCFANTALREIPEPPKTPPDIPDLPIPSNPPKIDPPKIDPPKVDPPKIDPPPFKLPNTPPHATKQKTWDKGLIGVVYEVTREDYARIIATEGGGASYTDIRVACIPIPPKISVPEKPDVPAIPRVFFAHTLYSPRIPNLPDETSSSEDPNEPKKPEDPRKKWYWKFVRPVQRSNPDYAQPSARYLKLITDGAYEHDLPDDYQEYLLSLESYTITTTRQKIGRLLIIVLFAPFLLLYFGLSQLLGGTDGTAPTWVAVTGAVFFNSVWLVYDIVFKPLFGDGERTEEPPEEEESPARRKRCSWFRGNRCSTDEEKIHLLSDQE